MSWRSLDDLIELTEAPDNAGLGIWNRADIEPHTNRVREYVPQPHNPNPVAMNRLKTHCPRGHPYNAANTYIRPSSGSRECRTCKRERREIHEPSE